MSHPIELSIGAKEPPGPGRTSSSHGGGKNDCAGLEYGGQSSLKDSFFFKSVKKWSKNGQKSKIFFLSESTSKNTSKKIGQKKF